MTLKTFVLLAGVIAVASVAIGYYLRLIISLGKRGSMELEIKEMMVKSQEEAKKILLGAENQAAGILKDARLEMKEKDKRKNDL